MGMKKVGVGEGEERGWGSGFYRLCVFYFACSVPQLPIIFIFLYSLCFSLFLKVHYIEGLENINRLKTTATLVPETPSLSVQMVELPPFYRGPAVLTVSLI